MKRISGLKKELDNIESSNEYQNINAIIEDSIKRISNFTEADYDVIISEVCTLLSLSDDASIELAETKKDLDCLYQKEYTILTEINLSKYEQKERIAASLLLFPFLEGITLICSTLLDTSIIDCFQLFANITIILIASFGINAFYLTSKLRVNKYLTKKEQTIKEINEFRRALEILKIAEKTAQVETDIYLKKLQELTPITTSLGVPRITHITNVCDNYEYDIEVTHNHTIIKKKSRKRVKK